MGRRIDFRRIIITKPYVAYRLFINQVRIDFTLAGNYRSIAGN